MAVAAWPEKPARMQIKKCRCKIPDALLDEQTDPNTQLRDILPTRAAA